LHHKVQKFSSGTGSPAWSRKKGQEIGLGNVSEMTYLVSSGT